MKPIKEIKEYRDALFFGDSVALWFHKLLYQKEKVRCFVECLFFLAYITLAFFLYGLVVVCFLFPEFNVIGISIGRFYFQFNCDQLKAF